MNKWKASIDQGCFQVGILPLIFGCYFSTLDPLSNTLVFLTASSYTVIL